MRHVDEGTIHAWLDEQIDPTRRTTEYGNMDRQNYVAEEYYADENHYRNFITFDNMSNGWVRNATAMHFVYSMVGTSRGSINTSRYQSSKRELRSVIRPSRHEHLARHG